MFPSRRAIPGTSARLSPALLGYFRPPGAARGLPATRPSHPLHGSAVAGELAGSLHSRCNRGRGGAESRLAFERCSASGSAAAGSTETPATASMGIATRKAWRYAGKKAGRISDMQLLSDELPSLRRGDVCVAVKAVGLNFADVFTCLGLYKAFPGEGIPGLEFSGVVVEIAAPSAEPREGQPLSIQNAAGGAAGALKVGDRVMGVTRFGAFADHIVLPAHQLRPLPESWDYSEGAAFLVQGLTAIYGLKSLGAIREGHRVLVHSAAGGVGMFALAICEAVGAIPIATVGSDAKVEFLLQRYKSLSPETVIVRDASSFKEQLSAALQATGASAVDIVLDAVAGRFFDPGYSLLERGGRYIVFGASDLTPQGDAVGWLKLVWQWLWRPRLDPMTMIGENRGVMGFNLIWMFDRTEILMELADGLQSLNLPPPHVGDRFPFTEAPNAIRKLQSGTTKGKVVLVME